MPALVQAEMRLFRAVRTAIVGRYVPIDDGANALWTISLNDEQKIERNKVGDFYDFFFTTKIWFSVSTRVVTRIRRWRRHLGTES
jgi:hypothetical protein